MDNVNQKLSDWVGRIKAELRRDKKKATVLVVLLIVASIIGGRFVVGHSLPGDASAAAGSSDSADGLVPTFAHQDASSGLTGRSKDTDRESRRVEIAAMDRKITRDLFRPNSECFPPAKSVASRVVLASDRQEGLFAQVSRWVEAKRGARQERLEQIEAVRAQAQGLSLQSTMLGRSPTALINGQVLRTGEWINGFRLKAVDADSCIISKDGVDVELRMKK